MANEQEKTAQQEWASVLAEREGSPAPAEVTPAPVETPPQDSIQPQDPPSDTPATQDDDPYKGLSPVVRQKLEQFDALVGQNTQLIQQLKETAGRVSRLQSEYDKSRQAAPAGVQPTQAQVAAAAKDPKKWEELKTDFPEWGEGIEAFVESRLGQLAGSGMSAEQVQQLVAQQVQEVTAQQEAKIQHELVSMKHEGWQDTVNTPDFQQWFMAQKPEVQALASSPKAADAIRMLDMFSASKAKPATAVRDTRQQRLAAAVTTKPGAPAAVKTFDDMTPQEQWKFLAQERANKAAG